MASAGRGIIVKITMGSTILDIPEAAIDAFAGTNPDAVAALRRVHGDDKLREALAKRMYHEGLISRPSKARG